MKIALLFLFVLFLSTNVVLLLLLARIFRHHAQIFRNKVFLLGDHSNLSIAAMTCPSSLTIYYLFFDVARACWREVIHGNVVHYFGSSWHKRPKCGFLDIPNAYAELEIVIARLIVDEKNVEGQFCWTSIHGGSPFAHIQSSVLRVERDHGPRYTFEGIWYFWVKFANLNDQS